jgi:hypothetical protein
MSLVICATPARAFVSAGTFIRIDHPSTCALPDEVPRRHK